MIIDGQKYQLGPLPPKTIFKDQIRIKQQYEELESSLTKTLGREKEREKKENDELSNKNESILIKKNKNESIGKYKGRENKESLSERKMSVYAKMNDVKKALTMSQPLLVLMYKDVLIASNKIDKSLPSVIVDLLQENEEYFPEEVPNGLPPIRGIEHQIDFIPIASILNYHEKTKEIQKQVSELMKK